MDAGHEETEKLLEQIEKDVIDFYSVAKDDIEKKYSTYLIDGKFRPRWHDITYRFWRKGTE